MNALADEDILQCLLVEIVRCTLDPDDPWGRTILQFCKQNGWAYNIGIAKHYVVYNIEQECRKFEEIMHF